MDGRNLDDGRGKKPATWIDQHRLMYDRATRHPFVLSIRDGTVDISAFERWLWLASSEKLRGLKGQDYIFVREFVPFLASVLLKAWKDSDDNSDVEVILGGIASLNDELSWFKKEASKWDVHLGGITPQKANLEYCRLLQSLMLPEIDYAVVITAFWAIETVYQDSFSLCMESDSKTPAELVETCKRWGNAHFKEYCLSLQKIADRCLEKAPGDVVRKAEEAFISVLEHEIGFWSMSSGES